MPVPPNIDSKIREKFDELLKESEHLERAITPGYRLDILQTTLFYSIKSSFSVLLSLLMNNRNHNSLNQVARELHALGVKQVLEHGVSVVTGMIRGLKREYEAGMLESIIELVEANVTGDYLGQAENLLQEGQPGTYGHVPAAVLTGAILEDGVRRLCQRQNPPIPVKKPNGDPKTLNPLIDELRKNDVINEVKASQLRAWMQIRNKAAHGEFDQFDHKDIEQMLTGVRRFLADYL